MIFLYVKTHNVTGLKYLGKTTQDPYTYRGSGVRWTNHIKKHGYDVTTEVIHQSEDPLEIRRRGIEFSEHYNVVESPNWANLIKESGTGGKTSTSFEPGHVPWSLGKTMPSVSEKKSKWWAEWRENNKDYKSKWKVNNYEKQGFSDEERARRRNAITNRNRQLVTCPHCSKQGNIGNMKRWHFDNCRERLQ